jgi:hypothetical protein
MGKYGTDLTGFGAFEGGVNADKGAPLVSTSSDGETALLFGPAALREIQTGVANGDFAIPPDAAGDTITEENPLPYWTFTDVNSAGAITCAVVEDATAGSGNTLRFTITAGTPNSRSVTLRRFIPVSSTRNQAFAYQPEVNTFGATNTANSTIRMQSQFYEIDQTTTTGTVNDSGIVTFATLGTGNNWLTGTFTTANAAPADAAFCLITITVATAAAGTVVASTVDIPEVRLIRGDQTNIFAEYRTPGTYAPTLMRQVNGELQLRPNGGGGNTQLGGNLTVGGGTIDTTGDLTVAAGGGDLIIKDTSGVGAPRLQFMTSDGTYRGGIRLGAGQNFAFLNANTTDDYGFVLAERFYPMNGTAGSRYISDTGSATGFSGAISVTGAVTATGDINGNNFNGSALVCDGIPTTTSTANNAVWFLNTGPNYTLRRFTSSQRYKTNIEDADEVVLEAAKKIKPRHFTSTLEDENGETRLGFIAEEIEAAGLTHAVGYNEQGQVETIDTTALIAALYAHVNDLEERLAALESR